MKTRRWTVGVIVTTMLLPGLTACEKNGGETSTAASAAPTAATASSAPAIPTDAKAALLASTRALGAGNFRFTMTGYGTTATGQVHLPSRSAQMALKLGDPSDELSMDLDLIHVDKESWVKVEFGGAVVEALPGLKGMDGKYLHLDQSKLQGLDNLPFDLEHVDPARSEALVKGITDVKQTGEGSYAGTIDVSAATDGLLDADVVKALGGGAKTLPFTATLDGQGRLTELVIKVPAAGDSEAQDVKVTYEYDVASSAQKPPADQVTEAADEVYDLFK